jgi:hypothetical protein
MKKAVLIIVLFIFAACKSAKVNPNEVAITSKKEVLANDYYFVINKIVSDSRCPQGVNCIWAGELVIEVSVWQNKAVKETKQLTFSPKTRDENLVWFEKFIPQNKKLKSYRISPNKTEKQLELKDYKIELILE